MTLFSSCLLAITIVAHASGYTTSLANHIARWLGGEGIAARVVTPSGMANALSNERLAFCVGFDAPTASEMDILRRYRARGGKLVVFHSSCAPLAALMGVQPIGYASAPYPGAWSRMNVNQKILSGSPASILQTSTVLHRAVPIKGRGRILATWSDRVGRSTGEAAWIQTDAGWWMTHVMLADGDEALKAQLLAAMCGAANPGCWNAATSAARKTERQRTTLAYAQAQKPRAGEIHAAWDHSGCGLYPGSWSRTIQRLKAMHVTDLFVNVAGSGFAHYRSSVLPPSKTLTQEGDQLAQCLAAAKGSNIRIHAWVLCFTATRSSPDQLAAFRRKGWCLKTPQGAWTEYLNPANAAVRGRILSALDELQVNYSALSGIHLDFVRYDDRTVRPRNAPEVISRFVGEARRRVKRPYWLTAAVLGKYPACIASVGQDWDSWLNANLVDYVVPMDYTNSSATFEEYVRQHAAMRAHARHTIAGIGVTANESRLDARQVIDQINITRRYGLAGQALFDLDTTLDKDILPYLAIGIWRQ